MAVLVRVFTILAGWALFAGGLIPSVALALTQTQSVATCSSPGGGGVNWTTPGNAVISEDLYATAIVDGTTSDPLQCVGYGFVVPSGATILGIQVVVERKSTSTANGGSRDSSVRLLKAGTATGNDYATATAYGTTDATATYGGTADLWGTTWTPADINNANFGVQFLATKPSGIGGAHTVSVDQIQVLVTYSTSAQTASNVSCATGGGAGTAWTNPARAAASDNNVATISLDGTTSEGLECTNYGFAIPAGSTIDGIEVNIERRSSSTANGGSRDSSVRLLKAGTPTGTDQASATTYPTADTVATYGGATDLWGATWTAADINDANFGASLASTKPSAAGGAHTVSVDQIQITVYYTPPVTTLGNGTDPGNASLAPGGAITDLDAFTFAASSGTDSITALTVTLTGANSFAGLSDVRITDNSGSVTYFTAVANPAGNTISFSGGTPLPVVTTATQFKVRITPRTHANMPAPPGATYTVGGTVTAFTSVNSQAGSDSSSAAVTIDNQSPNGATSASASPGDTQATLNWTTSGSADFSRSVVLRWAGAAGADVPAEGVDYSNGATIGAATVVCVRTGDAASTAVSGADGTGAGGCSLVPLINGTSYSYKVFQKDSNGNYDVGVAIGTVTPLPRVLSINCAGSCGPTGLGSVSWTVTFSSSVAGVASGNFSLAVTGLGGTPAISGVSGSGTTWTVSASTGSGSGTLGLNMANSTGVTPAPSNLPFTGQVFTIADAIGGVINTYYPGSASIAVGATSIALGGSSGASTPISIGDTVLIMQMQDATIDSTNTSAYGTVSALNAGTYEYAVAASNVPAGGGNLTLVCGTRNAYTAAAAGGSSGQKTYQVIRVPVYASNTLNPATSALAWSGSVGGVLAFDVTGVLALGGATVSVDAKGFRGGGARGSTAGSGANTDYVTPVSNAANGAKGEGIAGTPRYVLNAAGTGVADTGVDGYPSGSFARGAPASGGGGATDHHPIANDENPGGGGGANAGPGGIGGIGWCGAFTTTAPLYGCGIASEQSAANPNGSTGGFGGAAVSGLGATRLTMGGGGGAGTTNNSTGTNGAASSSGAHGGGIIMLRAGSLTGSGTLSANGGNGDSSVRNDGNGGGGAGGTVLVSAGSGLGGLTVSAAGGKGGDNLVPPGSTSTPHGPGGGGGGGYVLTTSVTASCSAAAGSNGVTYNNGTLFGAYGATSGGAGSCSTGLGAAQIPGTALGATSCLHHYELFVPSTSISCVPSTVTVTACTDASNPCTSVATSVNGTASLATSAGSVVSPAAVTGGSGSTTLSFPAATNGATATVSLTGASVAAANSATCRGGTGCTTTFSTAGFILSGSAGGSVATIPSQVAGVASGTFFLRAVRTSTTTQACEAALQGANTVNFGYECNDPTICAASNLMSVNGTTISRNNSGSVSSFSPVNVTFDANGNAPITLIHDDAGKVTLWAQKTVSSAPLTGSSNAFVVKPFDFAFSAIQQTASPFLANPGAADATGGKFVKAGETFSATITARTAGGAATPSFGLGTGNGSEAVTLTRSLVAPGGGASGALGGTTSAVRSTFTNGVATLTNLTWSEVGVITLAAANNTFLGQSLTTAGTSGNIGRFYPDHFSAVSASVTNRSSSSCPGATFSYMDEPFAVGFTLEARNTSDSKTSNYTGSFAKLNPGAAGALNFGARSGATVLTSRLDTSVAPTGAFSGGAAAMSAPLAITRGASPDGPYESLQLGIAPVDSDGTAMNSLDFDADGTAGNERKNLGVTTKARFGRLRLTGVAASALLPARIALLTQYWNGSGFATNTDDSCTALAASDFALSGYSRNLNACDTAASGGVTFASGAATLVLAKPGGTNDGSVVVTANLGSTPSGNYCPSVGAGQSAATSAVRRYLQGNWTSATWDQNPSARIGFGVFGAQPRNYIFFRENY